MIYVYGALLVIGVLLVAAWQKRSLRNENRLLQEKVRLLQEHEEVIRQQNSLLSKVKEDVEQCMQELEQLGRKGDVEKIQQVTELRRQEYRSMLRAGTWKNPVIDATIYNKTQTCKEQQIDLVLNLVSFSDKGVEDIDWLKAFYNLFDNAIESCMKIENPENRYIRVTSHRAAGFQSIVFENPVVETAEKESGWKRLFLKRGIHGYGTKILQDVAEKYQGTLTHSCENGVYTACLMLRCEG